MSFGFVEPWHAFLPRDGGHVLSFMGSGGKTSLQQVVADVYAAESQPTVLTTTTRCEVLPNLPNLTWQEWQATDAASLPDYVYIHGGETEPGKWDGLTAEQVDRLSEALPDRILLVEVDGAAKHPLKFYREGEPVWPGRTSLALVVMGVAAVGGPIDSKIHRWGRIAFEPLQGLTDYALMEWSHLGDLLLAPGGYLAQVPAGVPAVLAMTGIAEQDDSIGLFEFVGKAMEDPAFPLVMFCALGPDGWNIRTSCVDREDEV